MKAVHVYFDGGAVPNPGAAYGSYEVSDPPFRHKVLRMQFEGRLTSNQAEYLTMIAAVKTLKEHFPPDTKIIIFTDSQLLQRQMSGRYKVKMPHLKELVVEATRLLGPYDWKIVWERRQFNMKRFGH